MPADQSPAARAAEPGEPAAASRRLMRTALKGALATLDRETGHPYASLILLATEPGGAPTFLISRLALHTRNLEKDPRASVLIDGTGGLGDPLTGGRLTLTGVARPSTSPTALRRFLARHPSDGYARFADFSMYELEIARGHYIGGFGRIVDLSPTPLLADTADAHALIEAEPDIVAHMNGDHADALALYATELAGQPPGQWRMSGLDPEGADLLHCTNAARIEFPQRVSTPGEARNILVSLVQQARGKQQARA
jgi:heme oxygenase (biliverdin-IX-beta and delta-forming)